MLRQQKTFSSWWPQLIDSGREDGAFGSFLLTPLLFAILGALLVVAPRASPIALAVAVAVLPMVSRPANLRAVPLPVIAFLTFGIWAVISGLWSPAELGGLKQGLLFCAAVGCAHLLPRSIASFTSFQTIKCGAGLAIGFAVGALYLAHEVISEQQFLLWLLNEFPILRPSKNSMNVIVDGKLAHIHESSLKWSIAGLNLLLWPVLLLVTSIATGKLRIAIAVVVLTLASVVVYAGAHTTSKIAFSLAVITFFVSLVWTQSTRSLIAAVWIAVVLGIVPLVHVASWAKLQESSLIKPTGQQRLVMWKYLSEKMLQAPLMGVGIRSSYAESSARSQAKEPSIDGNAAATVPLRHAHNVYLQIWYELGLIGAILVTVAGLALIREIKGLSRVSSAFALAAVVTSIIELGSTWDLWQSWFVASLSLSASAFYLAARVADVTESTGIERPLRAQLAAQFTKGLSAVAIVGTIIGLLNIYQNRHIGRKIEKAADCQSAGRDCSAEIAELAVTLSESAVSQSVSKWRPTPFRIFHRGKTVVYYRRNCEAIDSEADLFLLAAFPVNSALLPKSRTEQGYWNHSFYFSGKAFWGETNGRGYLVNGDCLALAVLPNAKLTKFTVGQYEADGVTLSWSADIHQAAGPFSQLLSW